jgi:hypothetical protein
MCRAGYSSVRRGGGQRAQREIRARPAEPRGGVVVGKEGKRRRGRPRGAGKRGERWVDTAAAAEPEAACCCLLVEWSARAHARLHAERGRGSVGRECVYCNGGEEMEHARRAGAALDWTAAACSEHACAPRIRFTTTGAMLARAVFFTFYSGSPGVRARTYTQESTNKSEA